MIKNIIFDLSEVIISGYRGTEQVIEKNTNIPAADFLRRKMQKEVSQVYLDTMRGKYSEEEYFTYLFEGMKWDLSMDLVKKLVRQNLNVPVEGTMKIIQKLKGKYQLILLSDHVKEWMEYIFENNKDLNIFEKQYFSYEYGLLKSDKGCFDYILKDRNIKASETIFIDDYDVNIEMAKKSGIEGILFTNAEKLEQELVERGIL